MRTRRGISYKKSRRDSEITGAAMINGLKKAKPLPEYDSGRRDFLDSLPDDIVFSILTKLASTASCSSDFISVLSSCRRLNELGLHSVVLSKASRRVLAVKAKNWSESSHRFLRRCSDAGNVEASYTLGMIRFYCLQKRGSGASLMAKAAISGHAPALYSLAVIQFNGSGGSKNDKDLAAGVALCARAAFLGNVDALRELGHCLLDGYGVARNTVEGRRFLVEANALEVTVVLSKNPSTSISGVTMWNPFPCQYQQNIADHSCPLLSDFGCNVHVLKSHPVNQFLVDWFSIKVLDPKFRMCSYGGCGRPETRQHEFRRCSICGAVNYCSRACQALDWKLRHKMACTQVERWVLDNDGEDNNVIYDEGGMVER